MLEITIKLNLQTLFEKFKQWYMFFAPFFLLICLIVPEHGTISWCICLFCYMVGMPFFYFYWEDVLGKNTG